MQRKERRKLWLKQKVNQHQVAKLVQVVQKALQKQKEQEQFGDLTN